VLIRTATLTLPDGVLRKMADQLRDKLSPAVILLGTATGDGRAILACSVSKELTGRFKAGDLGRDAAAIVGGSGGGRPDFAQAGGKAPAQLGAAFGDAVALVKAQAGV
jgi:alanyl-tRNA synthetase